MGRDGTPPRSPMTRQVFTLDCRCQFVFLSPQPLTILPSKDGSQMSIRSRYCDTLNAGWRVCFNRVLTRRVADLCRLG